MANELQTIENNGVVVNYREAELEIANLDDVEKKVNAIIAPYKDRVYQEGDEKAMKNDRSELLALSSALSDAKKSIDRQYKKPLNEFDNKIKSLIEKIDEPLNSIRSGLKEIDEKKRDTNRQIVLEYIKENAEMYSIEPEDVEFKDSWANTGGFTDKMNMKKRLKDDVLLEIQNVSMQKQKQFQDEQALRKYAKEKGIDPKGWVDQLKYESLSEVMAKIDKTTEKKPEPNQESVKETAPTEQPKPQQKTEEQGSVMGRKTIELIGEQKLIDTVMLYAKEMGLQVNDKDRPVLDDLPW